MAICYEHLSVIQVLCIVFCDTQRLRNLRLSYSELPVWPKMANDMGYIGDMCTCAVRLLALTLECYWLSTQFQLHLKDETLELE